MDALTIGQVAKQAAVHIETLRYYERRGLVARPRRSAANYRLYPRQTVRQLRFVKRAQELGFSLQEIKSLLSLRAGSKVRCGAVRERAVAKIDDIDRKIRSLAAMRKALAKLVAECAGRGPVSDCPILDALDAEESHGQ
jgi:MerR family mercuric resistance operon transcriptional regulator